MIKFHDCCLCFFLLVFCVFTASGQTDGLGFCSHEAIPDKRTGLARFFVLHRIILILMIS